MKVLFVQRVKGIAGSEKYFLNIMPALKKRDVDCEFLCISKKEEKESTGKFLDAMRERNIKVHHIQQQTLGYNVPAAINRMYKEGRFDVVFSHLIHADFWAALSKRFYNNNIRLISGKHGYSESYQARYGFNIVKGKSVIYHAVSRFANRHVDKAFAISKALRDIYVKLQILPAEKIEVINYGFDFSDVRTDGQDVSKKKYAKNQLLIIGRILPVKGHLYAFKALKKVKEKIKDVSLVIVGRGSRDYERKLKALSRELGLESSVHFEGFQKDVHSYIRASDIVLIPSVSEGFCVVLLEAFHNQKPVVAFDVPAINEILDERSGILVRPFNTNALSKSIMKLIETPSLRKQMGKAGFEKQQQKYTIEEMTRKTIDLLGQ